MKREANEEGMRWLAQAIEDLKWTKDLADRGGYHIACFLAQQVSEKALKAFLYTKGEEIVIGQSVERLCASAAHFDPIFSEKVKRWALLDGYYIPTRYPNSIPDSIPARIYTEGAAREAAQLAQEVVNLVESMIKNDK